LIPTSWSRSSTNRARVSAGKPLPSSGGAAERERTLVLHTITLVEMAYVLSGLYQQEPSQVGSGLGGSAGDARSLAADEVQWPLVLERWPQTIHSLRNLRRPSPKEAREARLRVVLPGLSGELVPKMVVAEVPCLRDLTPAAAAPSRRRHRHPPAMPAKRPLMLDSDNYH
jgi:hypothetical protein